MSVFDIPARRGGKTLKGMAEVSASLAATITRDGTMLKERRLTELLAALGMTGADAVAAGYTQVTEMDCCKGAGFQTEITSDPVTLRYCVTTRLCPCYRLERR